MSKNTGGLAFPYSSLVSCGHGITVRDYFVIRILSCLLNDSSARGTKAGFAKESYEYADAMLAERSKE